MTIDDTHRTIDDTHRTIDDTHDNATRTSRRNFLAVTGAAVGGAALLGAMGPAAAEPEVLDRLAERAEAAPDIKNLGDGFSVTVRRPDDQLLLTLSFFNGLVDFTKSPPVLAQKIFGLPVSMGVEFGNVGSGAPMHVYEQSIPIVETAVKPQSGAPVPAPKTPTPMPAPPLGARIAGPSTLVFTVPSNLYEPAVPKISKNPAGRKAKADTANSADTAATNTPLTITTKDLLNFVQLVLDVMPNAVPPFDSTSDAPAGIDSPTAPSGFVTAIELPYRLIISPPATPSINSRPGEKTVFTNATDVVTHNGWTELWHTRLAAYVFTQVGVLDALEVNETNRNLKSIRAIWATDTSFPSDLTANKSDDQFHGTGGPFASSLRYVDRYDIVRLSSDFGTKNGDPYKRGFIPQAATVDNLMLSSLGGWLDCNAHWDLAEGSKTDYNSSLLQWRHRTVQGRDSYVRLVRKGFLFPYGIKASLVTVTERQFEVCKKTGTVGAYLTTKTFIVVTDPIKDYTSVPGMPFGRLDTPFSSIEAITLVSPDLEKPVGYVSGSGEFIFEPKVSTGAFSFHLRGTDQGGVPIDFHAPVLWVDSTAAYDLGTTTSPTILRSAIKKWAGGPSIELHSQRVYLAQQKYPSTSTDPKRVAGDTQLVVDSMAFRGDLPQSGTSRSSLVAASQPAFYPGMSSAQIKFPEAQVASGHSVGTTKMAYEPGTYLKTGFSGNPGGVFLVRTGSRNKIQFQADKSGGAVTPNLGVDGFSREIGPASATDSHGNPDVSGLIGGSFNPASVFRDVQAKLLGGIDLETILKTVPFGSDHGDNSKALVLTSTERFEPHRIVTTLDWEPDIQAGGPTVGTPPKMADVFDPGDNASLTLHGVIVTDLDDPSKSTANLVGQLLDFTLHLLGSDGDLHFIDIPFDSLTFRTQTGKKTDVDVQIGSDGVQFVGALSFVQDLADFLSFDGSGIVVDTAGSAITATLTLAIPTIAVGVFALENLAFSAGVAIPYDGSPVRFDFAFCSRENPFQLEIMIFTGGGFVGLSIGPDGVESLEFSFDFGLGFSIDIGIASGQVSLTGGVYYECDKEDDGSESIELTAWVKASGGISALGLVSVSVELYLGLSYYENGGASSLSGDAELSISVHIIFFGFSVGFSVHEEFAGSDAGSTEAGLGSRQNRKRALTAGPQTADDPPPASSTFGSSMDLSDWQEYCTSFALIGVGV